MDNRAYPVFSTPPGIIDNSRPIERERNRRDEMAWQVFLAILANTCAPGVDVDKAPRVSYAVADAFLAERKRQQGEA